MKNFKLLTLSLLMVTMSGSLFAITPEAQNLIDFKQMVGKQKTDWLTWMGKTSKAKYDLLAKEHEKWFKFGIDNMKKCDAVTNTSEKTKLMQDKLKKAIALYEEQKKEMETFWKNVSGEAKKMCDEQREQLHKFKVNAGVAPETTKEPMQETTEKIKSKVSNWF